MIKIFNSNDTDFSTNGNIVIIPLKCNETKRKSLNGWTLDVEIDIKYKEYIKQDKLCVVKTKSKINPQAFSIYDISYTTKKIVFKAEHVAFRARDYFLVDVRPTSLNGSGALNYINERTDNINPFHIISDVETISTAYFIRKNLLEAWEIIEERWGGTFDFDNYDIYFKQNIGNDNGEIVSYRKNLQDFKIYEDWSNVVTKLYPVGYDGIMLPEQFLTSSIMYDKYYTKTVSFETDLENEELTEEALISELRKKANEYLNINQYPQVCYEVTSNIVQTVDIGDTILVKHPLIELSTEVQEYDYNLLTKKITKLIFGNYNRDVKSKFSTFKENLSTIINKVSQQDIDISRQTNIINNLNKNGHVYITDNEIFVLDKLPKEQAKDVLKIGLGGIGISENGIEGPFLTAITGKGINADAVMTGTIKTNRIEGYSQLITIVSNLDKNQIEQKKKVSEIIQDIGTIKQQISGEYGMDREVSGVNQVFIEDALKYYPLSLKISGYSNLRNLMYPGTFYPGASIIPLAYKESELSQITICVDSQDRNNPTENLKEYPITITDPLRSLGTIKDELEISISSEGEITGTITRYLAYTGSQIVKLDEPIIEMFIAPQIELLEHSNYVYIKEQPNYQLYIKYLVYSTFNEYLATKVELKTSIKQTENSIMEEVSRKANDNEIKTLISTTAGTWNLELSKKTDKNKVITTINASTEDVKIGTSKLDVDAIATFTNSKLANAGSTTINGSNITTGTIDASKANITNINASNIKTGSIDASNINITNLNASNIKTGSLSADRISGGTLQGAKVIANDGSIGGWAINSNGLTNGTVFLNNDGSSTIYTVADLIIIRGYITGTPGFELSSAMIRHYDLNHDGIVNAQDYVLLQNLIGISMN